MSDDEEEDEQGLQDLHSALLLTAGGATDHFPPVLSADEVISEIEEMMQVCQLSAAASLLQHAHSNNNAYGR